VGKDAMEEPFYAFAWVISREKEGKTLEVHQIKAAL